VSAELILYAVITGVILLWLRNVIGTRDEDGNDRQRPNPYSENYKPPQKKKSANKPANQDEKPAQDGEGKKERKTVEQLYLKNNEVHPDIDNKTAERALTKISIADKKFDVGHFLDGARTAFEMIVTAFAKGDRDVLESLLSPAVYAAFSGVIDEREKNKQTAETKIHEIESAKIIEARLDGTTAKIVVQFVAMETHAVRNEDGEIVYGNPNKKARLNDIWVFSRDVKSDDPRWILVETRDGEEEAHEKTAMPEAK